MAQIVFPWGYVPNPDSGRPLANGYLYFGEPDLDPTVPANQVQLRVKQEDGTLVNVSQPLRTNAGGVPVYNGSPVILDVEEDEFSFLAQNSLGVQKFYNENNIPYEVPAGSITPSMLSFLATKKYFLNSNQNFTPSTGCKAIEFEVVGGGGGSGGVAATGAGQTAVAGGGGGGGYVRDYTETVASSYTVVVGSGGTGGASGNNNGTAGGNSSVTDGAAYTLTANGGGLGEGAAATATGNDGAGGSASGGKINIDGTSGEDSLYSAASSSTPRGVFGGDSFLSRGRKSSISTDGTEGVNYGGGASGAWNGNSQSARPGADGGDGVVIITEYIGGP